MLISTQCYPLHVPESTIRHIGFLSFQKCHSPPLVESGLHRPCTTSTISARKQTFYTGISCGQHLHLGQTDRPLRIHTWHMLQFGMWKWLGTPCIQPVLFVLSICNLGQFAALPNIWLMKQQALLHHGADRGTLHLHSSCHSRVTQVHVFTPATRQSTGVDPAGL